MNNLSSLTGKSISEKYFTYRSVQIFKIMFRGFYFPNSNSSHKIMRYCFYYSTWQHSWLLHFRPTEICRMEDMCTSWVPVPQRHLGGASPWIFLHNSWWRGQPLNIFAWCMRSHTCSKLTGRQSQGGSKKHSQIRWERGLNPVRREWPAMSLQGWTAMSLQAPE